MRISIGGFAKFPLVRQELGNLWRTTEELQRLEHLQSTGSVSRVAAIVYRLIDAALIGIYF